MDPYFTWIAWRHRPRVHIGNIEFNIPVYRVAIGCAYTARIAPYDVFIRLFLSGHEYPHSLRRVGFYGFAVAVTAAAMHVDMTMMVVDRVCDIVDRALRYAGSRVADDGDFPFVVSGAQVKEPDKRVGVVAKRKAELAARGNADAGVGRRYCAAACRGVFEHRVGTLVFEYAGFFVE